MALSLGVLEMFDKVFIISCTIIFLQVLIHSICGVCYE